MGPGLIQTSDWNCALLSARMAENNRMQALSKLSPGFISSPASVWALTVYSPLQFLGTRGWARRRARSLYRGLQSLSQQYRSAVIYARTPAVASRVRLRGRSKFLGLHLPMRSVYKYPASMIPCSPTTLTHFSCRRVLDFLIWTQSHACVFFLTRMTTVKLSLLRCD